VGPVHDRNWTCLNVIIALCVCAEQEMAAMFIVTTIQMSKVLKILSTICELLCTVDTDLIGFPLDVIAPK